MVEQEALSGWMTVEQEALDNAQVKGARRACLGIRAFRGLGPWAALRKRQSQDPREIGSGALVAALRVGVAQLEPTSRREKASSSQAASEAWLRSRRCFQEKE